MDQNRKIVEARLIEYEMNKQALADDARVSPQYLSQCLNEGIGNKAWNRILKVLKLKVILIDDD